MQTRILAAFVFVPVILVTIFFLPAWVFGLLIGLICAISAGEFFSAVMPRRNVRALWYCRASAFSIPLLFGLSDGFSIIALFAAVALLIALFAEAIFGYDTDGALPISQVMLSFFAGAIIPLCLGTLVLLRAIPEGLPLGGLGDHFGGQVYVLIPIAIAFVSDAGGYLGGQLCGKRKLIERVSPKKTIEGAIGAFIATLLIMLAFSTIMYFSMDTRFSLVSIIVYGLVGSAITQLGDLAFSVVKRECAVKDFGTLIPGHGGILDRFDSMIMLAPVVFALVMYMPIF